MPVVKKKVITDTCSFWFHKLLAFKLNETYQSFPNNQKRALRYHVHAKMCVSPFGCEDLLEVVWSKIHGTKAWAEGKHSFRYMLLPYQIIK